MLQSTTMPQSENGADDPTPICRTIEDTQPVDLTPIAAHTGAAAFLMASLASQEVYMLDLDDKESCEGFLLGIRMIASGLAKMFPECDPPNLPYSW